MPPRLNGAAWPYNNQRYAEHITGDPLLSDCAENRRVYVESIFFEVEKSTQ